MSVRQTTYVLFGALLPYGAAEYEACEPFFPDNRAQGEAVVLYDGMNGEWIAVGVIIDKAADYDGFNEPVRLSPASQLETAEVRSVIAEIGGFPGGPYEYQHIVLTHYR